MTELKRKPISKVVRLKVYEKFNGHCAYCGKEIALKDMQVDHIIPIAHSIYGTREKAEEVRRMFENGGINDTDNLMPACRQCNFYKGAMDVEHFRQRLLSELDRTCRSSFQVRLAMQYGMLEYTPWDGNSISRNKIHNQHDTGRKNRKLPC